jgi:hypothetical protein
VYQQTFGAIEGSLASSTKRKHNTRRIVLRLMVYWLWPLAYIKAVHYRQPGSSGLDETEVPQQSASTMCGADNESASLGYSVVEGEHHRRTRSPSRSGYRPIPIIVYLSMCKGAHIDRNR